jgi:hypothetical protein
MLAQDLPPLATVRSEQTDKRCNVPEIYSFSVRISVRTFTISCVAFRSPLKQKQDRLPSFFFPLALQPQFWPWPTSKKLSVSLQFTRSYTFGRTPWTGDQLVARPLPVHKHRKTHTHTQTPNVHALSGIRIRGPGFRATEDSACLKPLGYRERPSSILFVVIYLICLGVLYI